MPTLQVPQHNGPASKRQRYSHEDDILLARFWATEPQGTSDKLFQDFARAVSYLFGPEAVRRRSPCTI